MFRTLLIALVMTSAAAASHAADVYRYVDPSGGVHYTDTWVPGSTLIKVDHHQKGAESDAAAQRTQQNKSAIAGERAAVEVARASDQRAVQADVTQAREQQCKQAQDNYTKAIQSRRIYKSDKDGERDYLNDADADAYRLQLRTEMQAACGTETK
jgi:pullulanase/glycogen debranching enzyme